MGLTTEERQQLRLDTVANLCLGYGYPESVGLVVEGTHAPSVWEVHLEPVGGTGWLLLTHGFNRDGWEASHQLVDSDGEAGDMRPLRDGPDLGVEADPLAIGVWLVQCVERALGGRYED